MLATIAKVYGSVKCEKQNNGLYYAEARRESDGAIRVFGGYHFEVFACSVANRWLEEKTGFVAFAANARKNDMKLFEAGY